MALAAALRLVSWGDHRRLCRPGRVRPPWRHGALSQLALRADPWPMQALAQPTHFLPGVDNSTESAAATQAAAWIKDMSRHPAFAAQLVEVRAASGATAPVLLGAPAVAALNGLHCCLHVRR